jgi:molybdate transport system substrate-binding protein
MSSSITLLAAGSLRPALTPLITHFTRISGIDVQVEYGPAGLLRERIEAGEPCALFASANREHPQSLLAASKDALALVEFILGNGGQEFLIAAGFIPLTDE